ncbi:MAG TPA: nickel-dependent lactate racemase [Firmicutes bacterium]|nr:nickel-dependent lactate racemase [Bacillota bacterium]
MKDLVLELSFDGGKCNISIPAGSLLGIPKVHDVPAIGDPVQAIIESLRNPAGSKRLKDLASPGKRVALIVPDLTRPMPLKMVVPAVLEELNLAGVDDSDITIVLALGTHRPMTHEEIRAMLGTEVLSKVRVVNHNWSDPNNLIDMGTTQLGTPIKVNRLVYEADLKIGIGSVKPHRSAGWSGGGKIIDPGVCGSETIGWTHWRSVDFAAQDIMGKVDNPIRREMEAVAGQVGLDFIVNVVLNRHDEIAFVSSGHFVLAHRECVEFAEKMYRVDLPGKADILISGAGPWATDFWAAVAGLFMAEFLVRDGGTVVLAAGCPDGIAPEHPEILKFGYPRFEEIKALVETGQIQDLSAASHMALTSRILWGKQVECILVSRGIDKETATKLGLSWADSPQEAVDRAFAKHGSGARAYVLPADDIADTLVLPSI